MSRIRSRAIRALSTAVMLLVLNLSGAESARAGTYVMRNCNVPGYPSAPVGPWRAGEYGARFYMDACSRGGGFGFAIPGRTLDWQDAAGFSFARPTDGARSAIALQRVRVWAITRLTGTGYALFVTAARPGQPDVRVADPPGSNIATLYDTGPWTDNPKSFGVTLHCDGVFVPPPYRCNLHDEVPFEIRVPR